MDVFNGGVLLLQGVRALNTPSGVELAIQVTPAAAIESVAHEPEVVKASFEAFKQRKAGKPVVRLPPMEIKGRRNGPSPVNL